MEESGHPPRYSLTPAVRCGRADPTRYTYGDKPAHVIDREERAFGRNTIAGLLAVAGGACFLLGGASGAGLWQATGDWDGDPQYCATSTAP